MTLGAKSAEVIGRGFLSAIQDSSTPSDRARQDELRTVVRQQIRCRERPQTGLTKFIIKS